MSFLFHFLEEEDEYYRNWADLRRRRRMFWIALAAWIPGTLLMSSIFPFILAAVLTALPVIAAHLWGVRWPCPRCGQPFYSHWGGSFPFTNQCLHCGLYENAPNAGYERPARR